MPDGAPMNNAVAAPPKLIVVAVALTIEKDVCVVVIPLVLFTPSAPALVIPMPLYVTNPELLS